MFLGVSVYYLDPDHPGGLSKYNEIILSESSTVFARFKHIHRTFLGKPFTHCSTSNVETDFYTEHKCLQKLLMDRVSAKKHFPTGSRLFIFLTLKFFNKIIFNTVFFFKTENPTYGQTLQKLWVLFALYENYGKTR